MSDNPHFYLFVVSTPPHVPTVRDIPSSPRRSNRGGHSSKSKRKDESDDDGGQTRCVCKQQHHEGVMIQCETCKVWQHCPCVGLGNGEVTPDKYYCDSCRPQNHPYRVQNGILISGSKRTPHAQAPPTVPSLKTPVPKKRNTMNSKEASIPVDLMLAQQKWNDEHMDEIEDTAHKSNKRRKKYGSTTHDEDEEHFKSKDEEDAEEIKRALELEHHHSRSKQNTTFKNDKEMSASDPSPKSQTHNPGLSSNGRSGGSKRSQKSSPVSSSTTRLCSPTPSTSTASTESSSPAESAPSRSSTVAEEIVRSPTTTGGKRASSMEENAEENNEYVSRTSAVSSSKRRKTTKYDLPSRNDSSSREDDQQEESAQVMPKLESNMPSRSRKNGPSRINNKRDNSNTNSNNTNININNNNNNSTGGSNSTDQEDNQEEDTLHSPETPMPNSRRSFLKRERNNVRSGSRHTTPAPNGATDNGTPQPLAPPAPATVRYPSPKMSIQDMSKRAKQILDYISRVQIDMADRKSKSGCITPAEPADTLPKSVTQDSDECKSEPLCLPTAVKIASTSSMLLVHANRLPNHNIHETVRPESKEMTIKVPLPGEGRDSMLLSTPPLSIHDMSHLDSHSHQHHHHLGHTHQHDSRRRSSLTHSPESEFESSMGHEPITPPHQPAEPSEKIELAQATVETRGVVSSLELMDKLTGDLIRFQERFGACE
ncbi:hypothetical protein BGZ81_002204 [Podila clonocystis]|nr:hypothetical protein BGZ81_002204 [Podila clonocystis]